MCPSIRTQGLSPAVKATRRGSRKKTVKFDNQPIAKGKIKSAVCQWCNTSPCTHIDQITTGTSTNKNHPIINQPLCSGLQLKVTGVKKDMANRVKPALRMMTCLDSVVGIYDLIVLLTQRTPETSQGFAAGGRLVSERLRNFCKASPVSL